MFSGFQVSTGRLNQEVALDCTIRKTIVETLRFNTPNTNTKNEY